MSELVNRLAQGDHPVIAGGPSPTAGKLRDAIERQYVLVKFTDTRGGTDLGIRLDPGAVALNEADFEAETGKVHLEGTLTLDYVPVRCVADLDLTSLKGTGYLVILSGGHDP